MARENTLLIFALTLVFLLVYSPHFDYLYPFHVDEWHHIESGVKLGNEHVEFMEIGFDLVIHVLAKFVNIVRVYPYLPALFAVFSSFVLYYYLRKKSLIAAFIAIALFALLPSNVNLLGIWFFVPLTMAIPFFYLSLFMFEEGLNKEKNKKLLISIISAAFVFIVHPPTAAVMILAMFFIALKEKKLKKLLLEKKKNLIYISILALPPLLFFILFWRKEGLIQTLIFFSGYLVFTKGFSVFHFYMNPVLMFGIIPTIFAVIGLIKSLKIKKLQVFSFILLFSSINLIIFTFFDVTFVAHYQRVLYHFFLAAVPLAGIGFVVVYNSIKKLINKNTLKIGMLGIMVLLTIMPNILSYYKLHEQAQLYVLVQKEEFPALEFIRALPGKKTNVLVPLRIGSVLYTMTGKEPLSKIYWFRDWGRDEVIDFYEEEGCEYKESVITNRKFEYVLSFDKINCSFLTMMYDDNTSYVYSVDESLIQT